MPAYTPVAVIEVNKQNTGDIQAKTHCYRIFGLPASYGISCGLRMIGGGIMEHGHSGSFSRDISADASSWDAGAYVRFSASSRPPTTRRSGRSGFRLCPQQRHYHNFVILLSGNFPPAFLSSRLCRHSQSSGYQKSSLAIRYSTPWERGTELRLRPDFFLPCFSPWSSQDSGSSPLFSAPRSKSSSLFP